MTFTKRGHAYFLDDLPVPSFHDLLDATQQVSPYCRQEDAEARGVKVHRLALAYDLGALDLDTLIAAERGWLLAYQALVRRHAPVYTLHECPLLVHAGGMFFGTTLDRAGDLHGAMTLDLKTGTPARWHGQQGAAHVLAIDGRVSRRRRLVAYLKADGSYVLTQYPDVTDFTTLKRTYEEALQCQPHFAEQIRAAQQRLRLRVPRPSPLRAHTTGSTSSRRVSTARRS